MTIHTDTTQPQFETKAALTAEVKTTPVEPEKSEAEAAASAESTSTESETVENEEAEGTETESEASEPETDKDPKDPASQVPGKKKGGLKRRIDKLNARVRAKEQELEYWKSEALKGTQASPKTDAPKVEPSSPAAADGKPKPDSFETHAEYVEALTDWKTEQAFKKRDQSLAQSQVQIEQAKKVKSYVEKRDAFKASNPDFDEVMEDVADIQVPASVQELLLSSDNGPELAYELAKNRDELARICKLAPLAAARELGRLESKLSPASPGKKQEQKITKAPAPLAPVKGGGTASIPKTLDEAAKSDDFATYKKLREAELKKRRRA
jgi:hypothetical protein